MIVCFFGQFKKNYPRNRNLKKGLEANGVKVVYCWDNSWFLARYFKLVKKIVALKYDILFVPYAYLSAVDLVLAKAISKICNKKVFYDAFISLYDTYIMDRKYYSKISVKAGFFWLLDWLSLHFADRVICDTQENKNYFVSHYQIRDNKLKVIYVGSDEKLFKPVKKNRSKKIILGHWSSGYPLHGVTTIINAMRYLPSSRFKLYYLGYGVIYQQMKKMVKKYQLKNVYFFKKINYQKLPQFIHEVDIALIGPFGQTDKADRVLPNKLYEALACQKPCIVGDTLAIRRIFTSKEVFFCSQAKPRILAKSIVNISNKWTYSRQVAKSGYRWFKKNAALGVVGNKFKQVLEKTSNDIP